MDWHAVPRFGDPGALLPLVVRPSAYALIADSSGRVAVVRAPDGVFLPGGGIDDGETPEQALAREGREECGWELRIGACLERAVQFAVAGDGSVCYEKRSYFFDARVGSDAGMPLEPGHETLWLPPADAAVLLRHESHGWAVRTILERTRKAPIRRRIAGFHQDGEGHWVADLACGHSQHVRHDPPWQVRPWVTTPEGRAGYLGVELPCAACARDPGLR